jgi:hypothetical protein
MENNIKNWLLLDNKIKELNQKINELREKKNSYKNDIYEHISNNNLNNATIKIGNDYLKFVETKQNTPISYKFLIEALKNCLTNENDIENIINYIKTNRESKIINDIKRFNK